LPVREQARGWPGPHVAARDVMKAQLVMSLALASSTATASPPDGYGAFGVIGRMGGMATPLLGVSMGVVVEGGYRLTGPLWLHGGLVGSTIHDIEDSGDGSLVELRAGLEVRNCSHPTVCLTSGIDLAGAHGEWDNFDSTTMGSGTVTDLFAVPHIAIDVGGDLRLRGSFETPIGLGWSSYAGGSERTGVFALAVTLGIVVQH